MREKKGLRALTMSKVEDKTGLTKSSIYRLLKEDDFPKGFRITKRRRFWKEGDIEDWLELRRRAE